MCAQGKNGKSLISTIWKGVNSSPFGAGGIHAKSLFLALVHPSLPTVFSWLIPWCDSSVPAHLFHLGMPEDREWEQGLPPAPAGAPKASSQHIILSKGGMGGILFQEKLRAPV